MSSAPILLGNAVLANASAVANPLANGDWSGWGQAALIALTILIAAFMLRNKGHPHDPVPRKEFAKFVRAGVEAQTKELRDGLIPKLQEVPGNYPDALDHLRKLRKAMRHATDFIDRVDKPAFAGWPEFKLYTAFHEWAVPIRFTDRLLQDMLADLQSAAHKSLTGQVLEQYQRDEWRIRLDLEDLTKRCAAVIAAAGEIEHPEKKKHADEEAHH